MTITSIGRRAWAELGGSADALDRVGDPEPPVGLGASVDVSGLLADGVALTTLAVQEVQAARRQAGDIGDVRLDGARIRTASQSERHLTIDGTAPTVWAPLSGFWRASDGWVRTHGNYPHHAERLAAMLGLGPDADKAAVASAIASRAALDLEAEAASVGAIVGAVRGESEWKDHPQARALAEQPLISLRSSSESPARRWADDGPRPLAGIRILDLTRVIAGPVATRDLAFAGADVLRVDSPRLPEVEWQHLDTGAGKRSTRLDLSVTRDRRIFADLVASADVVVTGYRPSALAAFGIDADTLARTNPGLVLASVSAWGTEGPWAGRRGFDSIVQAVSGIAMRQSADGTTPGALPAQALDHSAGHLLAAGVCRALIRQRHEGGSWVVQIALARIAQELLNSAADSAPGVPPGEPTVQRGSTQAGAITCAAPPIIYRDGPSQYPELARPWGRDEPDWGRF